MYSFLVWPALFFSSTHLLNAIRSVGLHDFPLVILPDLSCGCLSFLLSSLSHTHTDVFKRRSMPKVSSAALCWLGSASVIHSRQCLVWGGLQATDGVTGSILERNVNVFVSGRRKEGKEEKKGR